MKLFYFLFLSVALVGFAMNDLPDEMEGVRRVRSHLLIDDPTSALAEAKELALRFPHSKGAVSVYIEALAANGFEEKALESWHALSLNYPDLAVERHLLEELSWGIEKGIRLYAIWRSIGVFDRCFFDA